MTKDQVVVFNEPHCTNLTSLRSPPNYTRHHGNNSGSIKFATTTASVIRTVSSTARSVIPRNRLGSNNNNTGSSVYPSTTLPRFRRHDHRDHNHSHYHSPENEINKTRSIPNRIVGPGSGPGPEFPSESTTLYPVFFYLTDKNGTYNQFLTESFIEFWNFTKPNSDNAMFFNNVRSPFFPT